MSIALASLGLGLHHRFVHARAVRLSPKGIAMSAWDGRSVCQRVDTVQQATEKTCICLSNLTPVFPPHSVCVDCCHSRQSQPEAERLFKVGCLFKFNDDRLTQQNNPQEVLGLVENGFRKW